MKWTKFEYDNPPLGMLLLRFQVDGNAYHFMGHYRSPSCPIFAPNIGRFTADDLIKYNVHYIYPQDLEMPE